MDQVLHQYSFSLSDRDVLSPTEVGKKQRYTCHSYISEILSLTYYHHDRHATRFQPQQSLPLVKSQGAYQCWLMTIDHTHNEKTLIGYLLGYHHTGLTDHRTN